MPPHSVSDEYTIQEHFYESSQSIIYRGFRKSDQQALIFKQLKQEFPTPQEVARFQREFNLTYKLGNKLQLKGIIQVIALKKQQNTWMIVMEDFGGDSLSHHLNRHTAPFSISVFLDLSLKICTALDATHQQKVIHKDITPANIVWAPETGEVKLIDFGIASELSQETPCLQAPDQLEGTLVYMSPEQTGRMNHSLDSRTDLYSLGASFYQMLTGQFPFSAEDPLELIHAHLAISPTTPHEENPDIPFILSQIILKLMAKNVEDRYQSAHGLLVDLQYCQKSLLEKGEIESFKLGQEDQLEQFRISQKLFGRKKEIQFLQESFQKILNGGKEVVMVTGRSGAGKSSLVQEVRQWVLQSQGYFASGKFDQVNRDLPYSSIIQAFQELVRQLLTESEEKLLLWKEKLLENLGENGQLILNVIPEVHLIIGEQQKLEPVPPEQAKNRFQITFQNLIKTFASPKHPLVLFLDDLQWIDSASLELLETILSTDGEITIFLLGAYRNLEVGTDHILQEFFKKFQDEERELPPLHTLNLSSLYQQDIAFLLEETFSCPPQIALSLAELCLEKTQGNPFFLQQFLSTLVQREEIYFNREEKKWKWDLDKLRQIQITDNVLHFLTQKIHNLSEKSQTCLTLAACIGNEFDFHTLGLVGETESEALLQNLWDLLQEGFIRPLDDNYKYGGVGNPEYRFAHDKLQQAAYSLLSDQERQETHYRIGHYLLHQLESIEVEKFHFEVVNHCNVGRTLIRDEKERLELVHLNFQAGKKAKHSIAFELALGHFQIAIEELAQLQTPYPQRIELHLEAAETAYVNNDFEKMEEWLEFVFQNSMATHEQLRAEYIRIKAYIIRLKYKEATGFALVALKKVGIQFPQKPMKLHVFAQFLLLRKIWKKNRKENNSLLIEGGLSPLDLETINLLNTISPAIYSSNPKLIGMLLLASVKIALKYREAPEIVFPYLNFALLHCLQKRFEDGLVIFHQALALTEKFSPRNQMAKIKAVGYYMIGTLEWSLEDCQANLKEGARTGLQTGDLEYSGFCLSGVCTFEIFRGLPLKQIRKHCYTSLSQLSKRNKSSSYYTILTILYTIDHIENFKTPSLQPLGKEIREEEIQHFLATQVFTNLFTINFYRMWVAYLFNQNDVSLKFLKEAQKYQKSIQGNFAYLSWFYALESLTLLRTPLPKWRIIKKNQKQIKAYALQMPDNFQTLWLIVEAEILRVQEKSSKAMQAYQESIQSACKYQNLHLESLANELAASFYDEQKMPWFADLYWKQASHCYELLGANAKVSQLEGKISKLEGKISKLEAKSLTKENLKEKTRVVKSFPNTHSLVNTQHNSSSVALDFLSVIKASQAISQEMEFEQLCKDLLSIMSENAGAERGFLLLEQPDQSWWIQTEVQSNKPTRYYPEGISPEESQKLSFAVFRYVLKTKRFLVLKNASSNPHFSNDPYVKKNRPHSILCLPIIQKSQLVAIIYFENNLIPDSFSENRIKVLELLASQVVISLENAKKHLELKETQAQLVQSEKMAGLGILISGVGHEINNPLQAASLSQHNMEDHLKEFDQKLKVLLVSPDNPKENAEEIQFFNDQLAPFYQGFKTIHETHTRLKEIVGNLRNFSRMDRGKVKEFNPMAGLESTLKLIQAQYRHHVEFHCDFSIQVQLQGYPGELNQVFLNLIVNACQAVMERLQNSENQEIQGNQREESQREESQREESQEIQGRLSITSELREEEKEFLIHFEDNGCGMSREVQEKIFSPFFTTKSERKGTGLGMYVSSNIIKKHKGKIKISSILGKGSTISLILPIKF